MEFYTILNKLFTKLEIQLKSNASNTLQKCGKISKLANQEEKDY